MRERILSDNLKSWGRKESMANRTAMKAGEVDFGPLFRLAGEIGREMDLGGLLLMILEKSRPWMQAEACSIFLPDKESGELVIHSARGDSAPELGALRVPKGQGIVGTAMAEKKTIRVDEVEKDARFYSKADEKTGWKTKALLAAPLVDGEECVGVIEFLNPIGRPTFTHQDEQMVEYFAGLVAAALVRIRANEAALERAAVQRDLDLARELQGLKDLKGVYVAEVVENGAGEKAGIKKGDVILKVAGIEVNTSSRLQEEVGKYRPGDKVVITVRRKSGVMDIEATLLNADGKTKLEVAENEVSDAYLGMKMDNVTREEKLALGVKSGVKVTALDKGLFKDAGIPSGFVITHINNEPVYSAKGASSLLKSLSGAITIEGFTADKKERVFAVKLPRKD